jgi:hypothetical protein
VEEEGGATTDGAYTDVYTTDPDGDESPMSEASQQGAGHAWLGATWGNLSQVRHRWGWFRDRKPPV